MKNLLLSLFAVSVLFTLVGCADQPTATTTTTTTEQSAATNSTDK